MENQDKLINSAYSLLLGNPCEKLSKLSDIIAKEILCGCEKKVKYFTLPIWDYENNKWESHTVGRFWNGNDWEMEVNNTQIVNGSAYEQYYRFFNKAKKDFSFIEFFTKEVVRLCPIFTIKYVDKEYCLSRIDDKFELLFKASSKVENEQDKINFIKAAKPLIINGSESKLNGFYDFLCHYKDSYPDISFIYLFPSLLFQPNHAYRYISSGGVILVCNEELEPTQLQQICICSNLCYRELGGKNWAEVSRNEAIKSAIAAIMSRNMSHNLGSHYLYYTKNQLAELADNLDETGPEIRGASKVLGYIQARMDYLATIVSGDKYPYGAVFFKGQIFDELTIDDFSKRHFHDEEDPDTNRNKKYRRTTNYLLQNLILSENFTRKPVLDGQESRLKDGRKNVRIQIKFGKRTFTGSSEPKTEEEERNTKLSISKLCIALPGGVMSIHAFYNVVENLVRNSAKYHKNDFKDELVFTIRINELQEDVNNKLPSRYEIIIFDNKANAHKPYSAEDTSPLVQRMNRELCNLKILTDKNELDKSNKGLKEMLFSTLWMRAYTYEKSKHMSDILAEIDQLTGDEKMDEIRQHAFEYVAVDGEGKIKKDEDSLNLGIRFELPKYHMMEYVRQDDLDSNLVERGLNSFTDIICVDNSLSNEQDSLRTQFTRVHVGIPSVKNKEKAAVSVLKEILNRRFPEFDKYKLKMDTRAESGFGNKEFEEQKHGIFFKTHETDLNNMKKFAYCEPISGENFTKTMSDLFNSSFNIRGKYRDVSSEYFALKIKEAALTRITLIDERLYNDMLAQEGKAEFLSLKNIRVLNLKKSDPRYTVKEDDTINVNDIFSGNEFRDEQDATHFLSIHLGMIEKIVNDDSEWVKASKEETKPTNARLDTFMRMLKKTFKFQKDEVFISIHSGRGNYSPELQDSLKSYPFISISALESAYANSKFLLAQLFYNTVYIGKGV